MICPACGKENREGARFCDECATGLDPADGHELALEIARDSGNGFVGRLQEMAQLLAALEEARAGRGRMVMLAGEPGIGKTTTAEELTSIAAAQDCQIMWGRCYEGDGAPPYWPWIQPLRDYIQQHTPEHLLDHMGSGASDIADILPELRNKLPNLELPPALEAEQARFRLFDSITRFLKTAALSQPLVLVLDDLHWADRSSLLLLEFLVRDIQSTPILVIGTYRDVEVSRRHPLSETLGTLIRSPGFLRLHLAGLEEPEVAQLIQRTTPEALPPGLSAVIHRRTEGNPLFVGEIISTLPRVAQEGDYLSTIPEGIRDAIGRRLNRLSEDCNHALTVASVLGHEFTLEQLGVQLEGWTSARLLEEIEEALAAGIVEEVSGIVGRYRIAHALIQETLVQELSLSRRVQLHATIAQALESLYSEGPEPHAAELAYHFAEAQSVLGVEKMVGYSLLAGEQALAAYAFEEAQTYFERGLIARRVSLKGEEPLPDGQAAELMFGLARAQMGIVWRGQMQEVVDSLARAFDYFVGSADQSKAIAVATYPVPSVAYRTGMTEIIYQALSLVDSGSLDEGQLLSRYGFELGRVQGDYAAAQKALNRALDIARDTGDTRLELSTLVNTADVDFFELQLEESSRKSLESIQLAIRTGDTYNEAHARQAATRALMVAGHGSEAHAQATDFLALVERVGDRYWQVYALDYAATLASLKGDWDAGRKYAEEALKLAPEDRNPLSRLATLECETGNFSQGQRYLEWLFGTLEEVSLGTRAIYYSPAIAIPIAARTSGMPIDLSEAADAARIVLSSPSPNPAFTGVARCGLGLKSVIEKDASTAAEQYTSLKMVHGIVVPFFIVGDRMLGLLADTMGELDQAVGHFEDSLDFCRKAGYRPELAWTCCDYSDTLLQRNDAGDRERANSLLEESLAVSTELGMRPLMERVQSRLDSLGLSVVGEHAYPDGLTQREVEVLRLIAQGKSNRDIGDELVISEATVRRHVSNIYDKIGVGNRTEAARYALRESLASED